MQLSCRLPPRSTHCSSAFLYLACRSRVYHLARHVSAAFACALATTLATLAAEHAASATALASLASLVSYSALAGKRDVFEALIVLLVLIDHLACSAPRNSESSLFSASLSCLAFGITSLTADLIQTFALWNSSLLQSL
jgi:hypothetical protein